MISRTQLGARLEAPPDALDVAAAVPARGDIRMESGDHNAMCRLPTLHKQKR